MNICGQNGILISYKGYCDINLAKTDHICVCHAGWTSNRCNQYQKSTSKICKNDSK